jgi:cytochrome o ubiquinol oxidase operon protein cyoD
MSSVDHSTGSSHGSITSYIVGFLLSVVITCIAFYLVAYEVMTPGARICGIVVLALFQLLVQLIFFLHLNFSSEARWNLISFVFTVVVVLILVFGSLWIMLSLNYNMMMSH